MNVSAVSAAGAIISPPSPLYTDPASQQFGVGLQKLAVEEKSAVILDISRKAREAAKMSRQARETETITQLGSAPLPVKDDEKKRRWGWRRRRKKPSGQKDQESFADVLARLLHECGEGPHHLDVSV